ncbi:TonB-dependent receptor [Aquisalinus flavus]|uniref:TonB-dependent receptor n=1 Tax=Aquisalinus flavus TaxID=1526572 RepID=A0A8J2V452_9PROT|nr:TonB-dependent receptor [Aquisalinus flavus]MBD0427285.1 TonB-dependent receptor [Aquisalinus flavus]UNE47096.1 TonB-dependent receptor [Aquisalinus flavus]GGC99773.1 TonB-dependent receptor [Aquisalinus flavus]
MQSLFHSRISLKSLLASTVAIGTLTISFASAQDELTEDEVIVVTGQALSLKRSLDVKREAENIVDASVQDDIGRLPDLNTAAVIRRISGVAVQNDQAEARFPVIRGLNPTYNRTTIDGGIVSSPERGGAGRSVPLDVIPASLLSRLEVVKSVTPEMDANAIGGTINVVTRSAFTEDSPFFYGSAFVGWHEQSGDGGTLDGDDHKQPWRLNFATGKRFGADEQFGLVLGFDYSIRNFEIPQIEVDDADYTEFDDAGNNVGIGNGNGIIVPTNNRLFFYNNTRERIGGTAKLEWQPTEALDFALSGLYTKFNDDERRDEFTYELGTSGASSQPDTITDQTPVSGVTEDGFGFVGIGRFTLNREISNVQSTVEWRASDMTTLDGRLTYSTASLENPESTEAFVTDATFGARYDTSDFFNRYSPLDPQGFYDPESYEFGNRGELDRFAEDEIFEAAGNARFDLSETFSIKTGGIYRDRQKEEGFDFARFVANDGFSYTLADVVDRTLADTEFQGNQQFTFRIDSQGANDFFEANNSSFNQSAAVSSGSTAEEQVYAGYLQGTYRFDKGFVTGGLRYESTEWEGGPAGAETVSGEYDNWLPSIVAKYNLSEDIVLRGAASQTIGRPDITSLTRGQSLNLTDLSVSRSNPDLQPRKSTNFDFSAEWYIPDGILAIGVFSKDIEDEIFTRTSQTSLTIDGQLFDTVTQPENASSAEILGFEAQYSQVLSFLPAPWDGFGVGANMTILDTDFEIPLADGSTRSTGLFQQPDTIYNLVAFYENDHFEVRGSYNWTGEFLDTINAENPNLDEYWDDRGQLDMQVRVNISDKLSLVAEGVNLSDEGRTELTGPGARFLQEDAQFGRTFWLGANFAM